MQGKGFLVNPRKSEKRAFLSDFFYFIMSLKSTMFAKNSASRVVLQIPFMWIKTGKMANSLGRLKVLIFCVAIALNRLVQILFRQTSSLT